ncbi:XRE family transcriptional regulator [Sinorhizobium meliloti]|uniref:XRE family transcriptional regulator n=1 Tax=Rhizobium meliloti TaxID=382 RepID=UPI00299E38CB|nr:XRE family transcriptional regulator [Sinorhizobium meliloti]MDW9897718.1 XRE family transcriptional regulator [Sinorhizobium meliloti]MDX0345427.1 XRE family transcriptional regulator [Sinorhizobium meliloti]MDX0856779.1 XRE family transcriptional regulator [Sinorhizobium medicae]MDX1211758.1 XRE family transcriptional regulator [Sinorhizobium medicae]
MPDEPSTAEQIEAMLEGLRISGMRPSAIARESGVSRQTVWRLSVGEASQPSYRVVKGIEKLWLTRNTRG